MYETVEVEAEVDFSLQDIVDALEDDDDAKQELIAMLGGEKYVTVLDETDMSLMLNHLAVNSFRFDSEDDELIRKLAQKYNF